MSNNAHCYNLLILAEEMIVGSLSKLRRQRQAELPPNQNV